MNRGVAVSLREIADLNPRLQASIEPDAEVAFFPMSAISAEEARATVAEARPYSEVSKGYSPFLSGDLLVAKITPCFENGKIAQIRFDEAFGFGSTEFHVIRPHSDRVAARYLLHYLRQEHIRRDGEGKMTGSAGQRRVPEHFLSTLSVPLPALSDQKRIASLLDKADALRAKRRATLALLDSLTSAVFLEMFGDPVVNPKGLPVSRLSELGTLDRGVSKHRPRNAPELLGGPYPLIQTGEIANCEGYLSSHSATYSQAGLNQSKLWPSGTLCITIAANIAKTGILMFDACFPDSVVGFRSDPATAEYVRVWLSFLQKTLEDNAPESAQKNINLALLRQLPIPVPSMDQRRLFADWVNANQRLRVSQRRSLTQLDSLFASLQHRAFNGELELAETEIEMSSK